MKNKYSLVLLIALLLMLLISFRSSRQAGLYEGYYTEQLEKFNLRQQQLLKSIESENIESPEGLQKIRMDINTSRKELKRMDFWFRYLEPVSYKQINGPLPVEWETEVFEKFEKPYKREGAGHTLAFAYLEEPDFKRDSLRKIIQASIAATRIYKEDSITVNLKDYHHFFLCNRLYLLNLAAIYTSGFECPDTDQVIPELREMLQDVDQIYEVYDKSYTSTPLTEEYLLLYKKAIEFSQHQSDNFERFDHFTFIRDYVNPLFTLNQAMIKRYSVVSRSNMDYSLDKSAASIFSKSLYRAQNSKGIFHRVKDEAVLAEIDRIGKLLFYDPILSGNNLRSCASCHKPTEYFTDTVATTSLQFNRTDFLPRNSPSLLNVPYNHLIMLDGKHLSLQDQTKGVIGSAMEMGSHEKEVLEKVLSCGEYNTAFKKFLKYTPQETEITSEHIVSAITLYYSKFSNYYSPFDRAMNEKVEPAPEVKAGFNLFMSKAQCATCHFVPQFNGVKPPYVGSEFEVLGTPEDLSYKQLSEDAGRYGVNPAKETGRAFRTGTIRNIAYTKPYMHNGVFSNLNEVIDFYDGGGGAGRGLDVSNQTLSSDSLHLTYSEKNALIAFMMSLNEEVKFEAPPENLPTSKNKKHNNRKVGGEY